MIGATKNSNSGEDLLKIFPMMIVSLFIVWAGLRLSEPKLEAFASRRLENDPQRFDEVLDYCHAASNAEGVALVWAGTGAPGATMQRSGTLGPGSVQVAPDTGFRSDGQEFDPTLFDLARRRNICLLPDGDFTYRVSASWSGALLKDLGVKTGIIVPLTGATGRGELVLAGIPLLSWDHLRLAVAIAQKVANAIDRREFELAAQEAALSRLRHSVARNLHDSVAQSLAGARFWLQALKMKAGTATGLISEIDTIQAALESENLHIRNLIGQLRNEGVESIERNLSNDIEVLLVSLSQQWRIDARLKEASNALFVPYLLSFEVQQIIREALANAVRHGQADAVEIGLWRTDSGIRLVIGDNGQGFPDPAKITAPHSISERVAELGGSLDISSMPGNSRLDITLPEVPFP